MSTTDQNAQAASNVVVEPHPLQPLQDHLSGATHNAGGAVKALEAWFAKEVAKLRAEFSKEKSSVE
jgi:hypothetical protein